MFSTEGVVESTWGCIGYKSGSAGNVTVSGNGSLWANSEYLRIGSSGSGTLIITEGGEVSNSQNGFIGFYSGSTGEVTVSGSDSTWRNDNTLYVGNFGSGTLNIMDGGTVISRYGQTRATDPIR